MKENRQNSFWRRRLSGPKGLLGAAAAIAILLIAVASCFAWLTSPPRDFWTVTGITFGVCAAFSALAITCAWVIRWTFASRRNFMRALFVICCCATLVALVWTLENWRGKRGWEGYKKSAEAKGEELDFDRFIPPPLADRENLAMTPLLAAAFDFEQTSKGVQWRDTNALERLKAMKVPAVPEGFVSGADGDSSRMDLEAFRQAYRSDTNYPQPTVPGTAAEDLLVALSRFDDELDELREAAESRPKARFPIRYEQPNIVILIPHLSHLKNICQVLQLRAVALLESGRPDEALADLKTAFRLSDSIRDEPLLISHLVRLATVRVNIQTVREGLLRNAWQERHLASIQEYLGQLDLLAESKSALRGELAGSLATVDYFRRAGFRRDPLLDLAGSPGPIFIPSGWFYQNQRFMAEVYHEFVLPSVDETHHRISTDLPGILDQKLSALRFTPYHFFSKVFLPSLGTVTVRFAEAQTRVDQAQVACAWERFRLENGGYPKTPGELVPKFLSKLPTDVINGEPLRFRTETDSAPANGKSTMRCYSLYSVGWDGTDDGAATAHPPKGGKILEVKGDWVWQLPRGEDASSQ